jgi:hypothetical protein
MCRCSRGDGIEELLLHCAWHEQLDNLGRQQPTHEPLTPQIWVNTIAGEQDIVNGLVRNIAVAFEGVKNVD